METIKLYLLKTDEIRNNREYLYGFVPPERAAKARRYTREADGLLSLGAGYLIKKYVGEYRCEKTGKPVSDNCFFGVSHSGDLVGLAVNANFSVGLDIEKDEKERGDRKTLAEHCLSESELEHFVSVGKRGFLEYFVAKESLSKAEGKGLNGRVKHIPALPFDGEVIYEGRRYFRHTLSFNGYYISVSLSDADFEIQAEEIYEI